MEINEGKVIITAKEYTDLLRDKYCLRMIMRLIYGSAFLGIGEEDIYLNQEPLRSVLKHLDTAKYFDTLYRLKEEKAKKEAEANESDI